MYKKYAEVNDLIIAVDENENISTFDKTKEKEEILELENELEVLNIKSDYLDRKMNNLINDFKKHRTPKQKLSRFFFDMNLTLVILFIVSMIINGAINLSSFIVLGAFEVIMGTSIKATNKLACEDYNIRLDMIKEDIDDNYSRISEKQKELSDKNIKLTEVETKTIKNINYLNHLKETYLSTYGLTDKKKVKELK